MTPYLINDRNNFVNLDDEDKSSSSCKDEGYEDEDEDDSEMMINK